MNINKNEYKKMVYNASPKSPKVKDFIFAYLVGGIVCVIGQLLIELFNSFEIKEEIINMLVPCILILISSVLTGIRVFEKIAKLAGAGVLVPITGFANAVVSPAIEFKNEGNILGVGAKIFTVAGPVILYGTIASIIYGIIFFLIKVVI